MKTTMTVFAVTVLTIGLALSSSFVVAQTAPQSTTPSTESKPEAQPQMTAALDHLNEAQKALEAATHDKGGHRAKALTHVKEAMAEVKQGITYDNTHTNKEEKKK